MKRIHLALITVLVVQLGLAAVTLWPRQAGASAASAGPLLGTLKSSDVVALTIWDKPDASLKLAKQGDKWVLSNADDFPADATKVSGALDKIVAVKTNQLVTKTPASQAQLKVADGSYVHRVDLQTADGQTRTLYIGSSPGANAVHVRAGGQNEVYLAQGLSSSDVSAQAGGWIDTSYLAVAAADVQSFTLKNASGDLAFTKDSGGNWQLADLKPGETMNGTAVTSLLGAVSSLQMNTPLGKSDKPEYGMAQPTAVLTLQTKKDNQDKSYTLTIGSKDSTDNSDVAKSSDSAYYVRVSDYSVQDLVQKKRADFLQAPPTPAAGAPGAPVAGATPGFGLPQAAPTPGQ